MDREPSTAKIRSTVHGHGSRKLEIEMKKSKGYTLPEIMISTILILAISTAAANLLNLAFKTYKQSAYQANLINQNSLALNLISNELRQNLKIYQPENLEYEFDISDKPLIFSKCNPATDKIQLIGYKLNYPSEQILRLLYESSKDEFDLNDLIELKNQRKILTQKTTQLKFIANNKLLHVTLFVDLSGNKKFPKNKVYLLKTKIRIAP